MKLQWLLDHSEDAKNVITAVLSEETANDVTDLKAVITKGVGIVFDLFREPLQEMGYDIDTRTVSREADAVKAELLRIQDGDPEN